MLWVNHSPGLQAIGASGEEYYREVWIELSQFIRSLRRELEEGEQAVPSLANLSAGVIAAHTAQ